MPSPASAKAITRSGATMTASRPPASAPRKIEVNGGNLRIARPTTTSSGTNNTREGWKTLWMAAIFSLASKSPGWPSRKNTARAMISDRPEVTAVSRTCS